MKKKYRFDIKLMMADCEANYARICRLLPDVLNGPDADTPPAAQSACTLEIDLPAERSDERFSQQPTERPAQLSIVIRERCRFTTTVDIQVLVNSFAAIEGESGCVNMAVRLYHDVNMAEVFACNRKPSRLASYEYPNESMFAPDEKAQQNRFLGEWLGLCLRHGMVNAYPVLPIGDAASTPVTSAQDPVQVVDRSDKTYSATAVPPPGNLAAGL